MKAHISRLPIYFVGIVLIAAGVDKVFHYEGFVQALGAYAIFPQVLAPYGAAPVILLELAVGVGLFVGPWRRPALVLAAGMLTVFTVALAVNYFLRPGSVCGCWFTVTLGKATGSHILQNLIWLSLILIGWWEERVRPLSGPSISPRVGV